jgi:hypothetical protein
MGLQHGFEVKIKFNRRQSTCYTLIDFKILILYIYCVTHVSDIILYGSITVNNTPYFTILKM